MLSINDLKKGRTITLDGDPYIVIFSQHLKMGRGGGQMNTKLRNLITGQVLERNFKGQESIEPADVSKKNAQFLYSDDAEVHFMDQESYETVTIPRENTEEQIPFLKEGQGVVVMYFNDSPIGIEIPAKVELKVVSTPPGDKGNSASGGATKEATTETGFKVQVPMFIKEGETIRVNTDTGEYVERA